MLEIEPAEYWTYSYSRSQLRGNLMRSNFEEHTTLTDRES